VVDHRFLDMISDEFDPLNIPPTDSDWMPGGYGPLGNYYDYTYHFGHLVQNATVTNLEVNGTGKNVNPWDSANGVYFGKEATQPWIGGYTFNRPSFGQSLSNTGGMFPFFFTPTAFPTGQYLFRGETYGYIQQGDVVVYAQMGQVADIKIQLLIGVNLTVDILFKKEQIITPTAQNMSARVRFFNDRGALVAEWMTSEGTYANVTNQRAAAADGTCANVPLAHCASSTGGLFVNGGNGVIGTPHRVDADFPTPQTSPPSFPSAPRGFRASGPGLFPPTAIYTDTLPYNYVPGGVTLLHVNTAGLPMIRTFGVFHPGDYFADPVFFGSYGLTGGLTLDAVDLAYYRNMGILGYPDYTGGWTVEVDFVNWYNNNTGGTYVDSGGVYHIGANYFPPPPGLLMGESFHYIPGHPAANGFGYTEQMALDGTTFHTIRNVPGLIWPGLGHSMAPNHLGPYAQHGVWSLQGTHLSGEASGVFEVDLRGWVSGQALAFTYSSEFRTISWAGVTIAPAAGAGPSFTQYTFDGIYGFYVNPGNYKMTIAMPGMASQTLSLTVGQGQSTTGLNFYLEESQIPIPEFSSIAIVAFSALAASLYLLRRRRH
jgi:hypothetical protein